MTHRDGYLGAHVGFDYLGDDDDDAGGGGTTPPAFDAIPTATTPQTVTPFTATINTIVGGGAQTNGTFTVVVFSYSGAPITSAAGTVTNNTLAGWSSTGWSFDSFTNLWSSTFTKASVTAADAVIINITPATTGIVRVGTYTGGSVMTDQAVGGGGLFDVTIAAASTFDVTASVPATQTGVLSSIPLVCTLSAVCGGSGQTNGSFYVTVYDSYTPLNNVISSITTTNAAGWSETGWAEVGGIWTNHYTKASVSVGTTSPTFSMGTGLNTGVVFVQTTPGSAAPQTDQATGAGNATSCHLYY